MAPQSHHVLYRCVAYIRSSGWAFEVTSWLLPQNPASVARIKHYLPWARLVELESQKLERRFFGSIKYDGLAIFVGRET